MTRGVEERVDQLTHAGWLNQEERVWALTAERDALAEKAVPATEAKPGVRMAEQGVTGAGGASRKKKKKKDSKLKKRLMKAMQEKNTTLPMTKKSSVKQPMKKKTPSKKRVAFNKMLLDKIKDSHKRLHDPTPDEETASGIPPNRPFKKGRRKKGAAKKASAGTAGFRVVGASSSTRGADRIKPPGQSGKPKITKPKLKKALNKIKTQRMPKASSAGMHTV